MSWLGRPWFLAAIALLITNDHLLKNAWPGVVTGKVSDFAGLVVVSVLTAVVFGPRWGTILAGCSFLALKTVLAAAEFAAPVLGGLTRLDPSDLIALVVLPAVWWALARPRPDADARSKRALQIFGLVAAILAVSATSKGPEQVDHVWFEGRSFFADVTAQGRIVRFHSEDDGRNWTPEVLPADATSSRRLRHNGGEVCSCDLTCYRTGWDRSRGPQEPQYRGSTVIDRRLANGECPGSPAAHGSTRLRPHCRPAVRQRPGVRRG